MEPRVGQVDWGRAFERPYTGFTVFAGFSEGASMKDMKKPLEGATGVRGVMQIHD